MNIKVCIANMTFIYENGGYLVCNASNNDLYPYQLDVCHRSENSNGLWDVCYAGSKLFQDSKQNG